MTRVLVWNVHQLRAGVGPVAAAIERHRPDLVLLNETGPRRRLRALGRELGMTVARDPLSPLRRRIRNAVLARSPWRIVEHRLHRFADVRRRLNPRGALLAVVEGPPGRLGVCCLHLGLHPLERLHAAREVVGLDLADPAVVGGDLNELPDGRAVGILRRRFADAWSLVGEGEGATFPAPAPRARIDYLFVSGGLAVRRAWVPTDGSVVRASDHLPLVVDLDVAGEER
ncbi:hypothetical protein HRbin12_00273 [bacterium HR12]|nr:hypothetical protein HRbin12_00273 [bacterium HR12]